MDPRPPLYDPLLRLLRAASPLMGRGGSKLARGIRGRRDAAGHLERWGRRQRDPGRPVIWFHAPSVGEGLQARAVMEALLRRAPRSQLVYTHFSPSAEGLARRMPAEVAGHLPWDDTRSVRRVLEAVKPDLVAFSKTEVWPGLASEARARGIPLALVAGTLPPRAGRLRNPGARFLRRTFGALDRVFAVGPADAERFGQLGVPPERVEVLGDPAVDSAWERARATDRNEPHLAALRDPGRPTLVAGSTWPPDEDILFRALPRLRKSVPSARVVVAPHEPTEEHVDSLLAAFREQGWEARTLAQMEESAGSARDRESPSPAGSAHRVPSAGTQRAGAPVEPTERRPEGVVVERVGVLAQLYTVAHAAYVGGGFHRHGLHSVLEPAAAGLPVLFGPRHENAPAAGALADSGGGRVVHRAEELGEVAAEWLGDPPSRDVVAKAASAYIDAERGAAERTAAALLPLLAATWEKLHGEGEDHR